MRGDENRLVKSLERVIRLLADVWPNNRENVAIAGVEFEELAEELANAVSLRSLIDLTWRAMMYLYQKEDYFHSVKNATMQAVNLIREYQIGEADVQVEQVQAACDALESALAGRSESADTVLELDEVAADEAVEPGDAEEKGKATDDTARREKADRNSEGSPHADSEKSGSDNSHVPTEIPTLNDLAASIMELEEETVNDEELESFADMLSSLLNHLSEPSAAFSSNNSGKKSPSDGSSESQTDPQAAPLQGALDLVQKTLAADAGSRTGWLAKVSELVEVAIQIEVDREWGTSSAETDPSGSEEIEELEETETETETEEAGEAEGSFTMPEDTDPDMIDEFISECNDLIETAESALLALEETPDDEELVNTVFRAFHTIKGTSAFMGLMPVSEFTHSAETMLDRVREGDLAFDPACADILFRSIDILKELLDLIEVSGAGDAVSLPPDQKHLTEVLDKVSLQGVKLADALSSDNATVSSEPEGSAEAQVPGPAAVSVEPAAADGVKGSETDLSEGTGAAKGSETDLSEGTGAAKGSETDLSEEAEAAKRSAKKAESKSGSSKKAESESSVRVNVSRLDRLVDMVGELVIAHSVVAQDSVLNQDMELQKKVNHASKILRELQDTSLTLRMVPLKSTFQKMNRLVRDLSRKAGKPVTFSTLGEDTEIDRNMVDIINEPLVHMLRNALDHGVEEPEVRKQTDKPDVATIWFRAFQEGGKVVIEIEDDGKGIDKEKILEKGISKGLVEPDARMSDSEIFSLIFRPGFSSVEKVTDLSGRGVGMDVVRRSIEKLQGKIEVTSDLGKGTKISLEIPFTLAITDGMLVRVGSQRFIIPIMNIDTAFRAEEGDLYTVMDTSDQVMCQGRTIPVVRLHRLFNIDDAVEHLLEGTMLVVRSSSSRYALFVDDVIGQKQLVGKSIDMNVKMNHISGGAILEDGQVGLILDTAAIVN